MILQPINEIAPEDRSVELETVRKDVIRSVRVGAIGGLIDRQARNIRTIMGTFIIIGLLIFGATIISRASPELPNWKDNAIVYGCNLLILLAVILGGKIQSPTLRVPITIGLLLAISGSFLLLALKSGRSVPVVLGAGIAGDATAVAFTQSFWFPIYGAIGIVGLQAIWSVQHRKYVKKALAPNALSVARSELFFGIFLLTAINDQIRRLLPQLLPFTLTRCAEAVRVGLSRNLGSLAYSSSEKNIIQLRCEGAARVLDSYRIWMLLPNQQSYSDLKGKLAETLLTLINEHYDDLPMPDDQASISRPWVKIRHWAKSAVIGLSPTALLLGYNYLGTPLPATVYGATLLACLVWAGATLLIAFDPLAKERAALTADIFSILRQGGPKT
ncbi:hypothetical protein AB0A63_39855 [Lentzea sp. NPDC042327]|uniref:hypothetical protein n=1 Tax=Lentzea sp. NPDC042327 TaxID=3154801 RepID=UPI0034029048